MKSHLRASKASGSAKRKVETLIKLGWYPGCRMSDLKPNRRFSRLEAASRAF